MGEVRQGSTGRVAVACAGAVLEGDAMARGKARNTKQRNNVRIGKCRCVCVRKCITGVQRT